MNATMTPKRGRPVSRMSKTRVSSPMISDEARLTLDVIADSVGSSVPGLLAQVGEAAKKGKPENWHRAVAAFQDAIER